MYKTSDYYAPDCEQTVAWNDPGLAINWGRSHANLIISTKDAAAQSFETFHSPFHLSANTSCTGSKT
jgi:dTDP-4-dehydrorhamnose 3,5-epimerase